MQPKEYAMKKEMNSISENNIEQANKVFYLPKDILYSIATTLVMLETKNSPFSPGDCTDCFSSKKPAERIA